MSVIDKKYSEMFASSAAWYERGKNAFAGGVTHQSRFVAPFPTYYEWADGPFKYDVDGNEIIDYVMGNGSLLLGHNPKSVMDAINAQMGKGTHLGGATTHETRYAEAVKRNMPKLDSVRFTSSGTESTLLAMRIARGYTGKDKIIKFYEHFHGWHDYATVDSGQSTGGIPKATLDQVIVLKADIKAVDKVLSKRDDVAGVIVECNGAHFGTFPLQNPTFLHDLQEICLKHNVMFIMDEVITGFRLSMGGAQKYFNVIPDLCIFGKAMASGYPISVIAGKRKYMQLMTEGKVIHAGTMNSCNPCIAAATATIEVLENEKVHEKIFRLGKRLMDGLIAIKDELGINMLVQGPGPMFHVSFTAIDKITEYRDVFQLDTEKSKLFIQGMHNEGIRTIGRGLWYISNAHTVEDIDYALKKASIVLSAMAKT